MKINRNQTFVVIFFISVEYFVIQTHMSTSIGVIHVHRSSSRSAASTSKQWHKKDPSKLFSWYGSMNHSKWLHICIQCQYVSSPMWIKKAKGSLSSFCKMCNTLNVDRYNEIRMRKICEATCEYNLKDDIGLICLFIWRVKSPVSMYLSYNFPCHRKIIYIFSCNSHIEIPWKFD